MKNALRLIPLAAIAGGAMYLMDSGGFGSVQSELSAMLLALLVVMPLFSGWLEH